VDVSALVKEAVAEAGGRGGGSKDLAQGGIPDAQKLPGIMEQVFRRIIDLSSTNS
jgi:alanyl-tRNA synthetase